MSPAMALSGRTRTDVDDSLEVHFQKGVQHMHQNGIKHVPGKYILPLPERPDRIPGNSDKANLNLPVIDFAQFQGPDRPQALKALAHACECYGFFQVVNHGIPAEALSDMMNVTKRFFEMPISDREQYMSADMRLPVRYGTSFNQTNDGVFCWRDFLKLVCHPLPDVLPHWPSSPTCFRETMVLYAKQTRALFLDLVEAILETLDPDNIKNENQETLINELEDGSQMMVLNCYPPCPDPNLTLGMPPHSDYGFLTILLQDQIPGLQIQHQHNWLTVNPIPGSFVVNVGDHLEIFSNGRFKSVLHRVVVNSDNCRVSVASLHSFPSRSTVRPLSRLVSVTNPSRYKDTDFDSFLEYITSCDSKNKNFLESRKLSLIGK